MPTLCGLRRRGYTARSIRNFCERIGVAKSPNTVEYGFLEHCLQEDLNAGPAHHGGAAPGEAHGHQLSGRTEQRPSPWRIIPPIPRRVPMRSPSAATCGSRRRIFWRCLFPSIRRLYPDGPECRLKGAYLIRCTGCVKDENGRDGGAVQEYDPNSRAATPPTDAGQGRYPPLGGCRQLPGCRGAAVRQPVLPIPSPTARTRIFWTA